MLTKLAIVMLNLSFFFNTAYATANDNDHREWVFSQEKQILAAFLHEKETQLLPTKAQWQRHAYSILLSVKAVGDGIRGAFIWAASIAVGNRVRQSGKGLSGKGFEQSVGAFHSVKKIAEAAPLNAVWTLVWGRNGWSGLTQSVAPALCEAKQAFSNYARGKSHGDVEHDIFYAAFIPITEKLKSQGLHSLSGIPDQAYRSCERAALSFFLTNAEKIFDLTYTAAWNTLPESHEGFFASAQTWGEQRARYNLDAILANPQQAYFIEAWVGQLDRIANKIDELE